MNKLLSFIAIVFIANLVNAQLYVDWINPVSGTSSKYVEGLEVDNAGNVYTAGYYLNTVDVDPTTGVIPLMAPPGSSNVFVTKSDAAGNFLWACEIAGASAGNNRAYDIAVDNAGNSYVVGSVSATRGAITKINSSGIIQWTIELGSATTQNYVRTIALDNAGGLIVGGQFQGTTDFDPGAGVSNLTPTSGTDGFIGKYTDAGAFVWAKAINGASTQVVWDLALDASSNIYATGYYSGLTDFDPNGGTYNLWNDSEDGFILNLSSTGNFVWAKRLTGLANDRTQSIGLDGTGNVYVAGYYNDDLQYDPGPNAVVVPVATNEDAFVLKTQSNGTGTWFKSFGGPLNDRAIRMVVETNGDVFITGNFESTADLDPSASVHNETSVGLRDGYISSLDASGNFQWAAPYGGTGNESSKNIKISSSGEIHLTGTFTGTVDFNPGVGVSNLSSVGATADIFTIKYNFCSASGSVLTASACDSYLSPAGNTYTTTGTYTDTLANSQGCDSLITIQLTVGTTPTVSLSADLPTICSGETVQLTATSGASTLIWNNGLPNGTTQNVTPSITTLYQVIANDGNGCADTSSLNIIVNQYPTLTTSLSDTIVCYGDSLYFSASGASTYYWDYPFGDTMASQWYTPIFDNNYLVYGMDSSGNCESLDSFFVQVNSGPTGISSGTNGGNWMWVNDTINNFQWYMDGNIIPGETNNDYVATQDGEYTVHVIDSVGCYTMFTWTYSTVGIIESFEEGINIYPNPTNGLLNVEIANDAEYSLYTTLGIKVDQNLFVNGLNQIDLNMLPPGTYFIEIIANDRVITKTILKQ